jgi:hypothetical protein
LRFKVGDIVYSINFSKTSYYAYITKGKIDELQSEGFVIVKQIEDVFGINSGKKDLHKLVNLESIAEKELFTDYYKAMKYLIWFIFNKENS